MIHCSILHLSTTYQYVLKDNNELYKDGIKEEKMPANEAPLTEAFFYILLALRKPNHGYGIVQEVDELTKGRVSLGAGTLYGALQTLEKRNWIRIYSEDDSSRKKKEYIITEEGLKAYGKELARLNELAENGKLMFEEKGDKNV